MTHKISNEQMETILYPRRFLSKDEVEQYTSGDKVTCLICDKSFMNLSRHISGTHGCDPKKYRDILNIPRTMNLMCKDFVSRMRTTSTHNFYNKLTPEQRHFLMNVVHNPTGESGKMISTIAIEERKKAVRIKGKNKGKKHGRTTGKCHECGIAMEISTQRVNRVTKCSLCIKKSQIEFSIRYRKENKEKIAKYHKELYQLKKKKQNSVKSQD